MSHQVLISFDIDENRVQENAEKEAARMIVKDIFGDRFSYGTRSEMSMYVQKCINEILEPMKDEIIKEAVSRVVENLHRTKAVKQMLEDAANEN